GLLRHARPGAGAVVHREAALAEHRDAGERRAQARRSASPGWRREAVSAPRHEARPRSGWSGQLLTRPRAAIVVTGSELVRGERNDRNGPFLASQALSLGLEPARITIVGDRPEEL